MTKISVIDYADPDCPVRNVLSRISDKWSLLVLYTLKPHEVMRFGQFRKAIPDISQKMLTSTLRTLEEDGFVTRRAYAEIPPRVEYSLTPRAHSLIPHLEALIGWAADNMPAIIDDRRHSTSEPHTTPSRTAQRL